MEVERKIKTQDNIKIPSKEKALLLCNQAERETI